MRGLIAVLALAGTAGLIYYGFTRGGNGDEFPENWHYPSYKELSSLVGQPMPALKVSNWYNGKVLTPEMMKGKIIVVDLWAVWCGPCLQAIPHNNELQKKYGDKGVVVLGICTDDKHERMAEVAKSQGVEYYCAEDTTLEMQSAWKVAFYPTYCVVDRKGIVRGVGLHPPGVEMAVQKLLAEP